VKISTTTLPGVLVLEPQRFSDDRGYFFETWQQQRYVEAGITEHFVQDNVSRSKQGVLRGLHFQNPHAQGKLLSVLDGEIFDVAVDVQAGSKSFGQWFGIVLSAKQNNQLWVPPSYAHGFYVLSDWAVVSYKCTALYAPQAECSLRWDDPDVAIEWPRGEKILAAKDRDAPLLRDIAPARLEFTQK
jgi:dTDP-4-dehydrorhamnose 3,5-epimerase